MRVNGRAWRVTANDKHDDNKVLARIWKFVYVCECLP